MTCPSPPRQRSSMTHLPITRSIQPRDASMRTSHPPCAKQGWWAMDAPRNPFKQTKRLKDLFISLQICSLFQKQFKWSAEDSTAVQLTSVKTMTHPAKMMGVVLEIVCCLLNVNWKKLGNFSALLLVLSRRHLMLLPTIKPESFIIRKRCFRMGL